jgi:hypothetical protein
LLYTGAKFFYLQEVRKIYSTLYTGANFSIFVGEKLEKLKSHPNGPHEGVSPRNLLKWASWRSKSQKLLKWASWRSKSQEFAEMGLVEE